MNAKLDMKSLMAMSDIKRWHTIPMAREQTLSDHGFRVALLALRLRYILVGEYDITMLTTALFAMLHDAAEVHLGDPPPDGKYAEFKNAELKLFKTLPMPFNDVDDVAPNTRAIVEIADRIDAWLWVRENGIGDRAKAAMNRCFSVMNDMAVRHKMVPEVSTLLEEIIGKDPELCPF